MIDVRGELLRAASGGVAAVSSASLRPHQRRVFEECAAFLEDVATRPEHQAGGYGRVILPPRTGKTVIAAAILGHTRLPATFIVPTKALVDQTVRELKARLPEIPVGTYFSERKELVARGVNVTTYAILQRDLAAGRVPRAIRESALVFADEAHHALTPERTRILLNVFPRESARIALTATRDYDDERVLCQERTVLDAEHGATSLRVDRDGKSIRVRVRPRASCVHQRVTPRCAFAEVAPRSRRVPNSRGGSIGGDEGDLRGHPADGGVNEEASQSGFGGVVRMAARALIPDPQRR